MEMDDSLLDELQQLSKLELTREERTEISASLGQILAYMGTLSALDCTGVEPLSQPFPSANVFREDLVLPAADREALLDAAPRFEDGFFQAPRTVE